MPDAKEMSGIPRPVGDLPDSTISVRLIRGSLANNITGHDVSLRVGGKTVTVKTDESGRAEFKALPPGVAVTASADVDGEHLASQEFPVPARGGIRLLLVATDPNRPAAPKPAPGAPAATGAVSIGDQSRFVLQPREEAIDLFYLLDIANTQSVPINPPSPFVIDLPAGASGAAIMDGSSPQASVKGSKVTVAGPFAPGHTFVQVAMTIAAEDGVLDFSQRLPANLDALAVIVKKMGNTTLKSPQLKEQREMPADGDVFIAATGGAVAAGQPIQLTVDGIPHHSQAPRRVALALATMVALAGAWFASRPTDIAATQAGDRKRLVARREKLLNEVARLDREHRGGRGDERRYAARREELVTALEAVYNALDTHEPLAAARGEPGTGGRVSATA